nr:molybdopterin dinucleotide binding domain-containing protein [Sphingobium sp. JAI105]
MAESPADAGFTHRFAVRRLREVLNTTMHRIPAISCRVPANHAYLHPDDMAAIGVADGDAVLIRSAHGRIEAVAQGDDAVRPGVLSMAHGWGPLPSGGDAPGVNVNLLIDAVKGADPINAMPVMTGFPVRVERAAGRA